MKTISNFVDFLNCLDNSKNTVDETFFSYYDNNNLTSSLQQLVVIGDKHIRKNKIDRTFRI